MTGLKYQVLAMRTNDKLSSMRLISELDKHTDVKLVGDDDTYEVTAKKIDLGGVLNASLGLSGEVGEFNDMIKKWIFHNKPLDEVHLQKELGDICWYIALMAESFGWDLEEIMEKNIDKLMARYPEGFDTERANNRKEGDV